MKKIPFLFITILSIQIFLLIGRQAFSQAPIGKIWDYRFGGDDGDWFSGLEPTRDGGCILIGYSISMGTGDKTQPSVGLFDYWIVKVDSNGNKQWDKDFGGDQLEYLKSIKQTNDGGYILGGSSYSGISGNKSQNSNGYFDYWIVKIDSVGNFKWDKSFGGSLNDNLMEVRQTSDGGYILGGYSESGISGDKTQDVWGDEDFWVVKTDSMGIKLWDKDFGGIYLDQLYAIDQTSDGGFILGGHSYSPVSGDKSQPGWGALDFWILKTDSMGNKLWDKDFGGTDQEYFRSVKETQDGGLILGGWSWSSDGNKSQSTKGFSDYWIIKTDASGNIRWDKDFGGIDYEEFSDVKQTLDGGFLLSGDSYSPISGDKSESNLGLEQTWIVKTDSIGNKQWDKTIFTIGHDEDGRGIQTRDGCFIFGNLDSTDVGGYKTQPPRNNSYDYWIVKFCELPTAGFIAAQNVCPGTCVTFFNASALGQTYIWNFPGANPDTSTASNPTNICYYSPGSYSVTLIAINDAGSDTLTIPNFISVFSFPPSQGIMQSGDTLISNQGFINYEWYHNGILVPGATDYFLAISDSGNYNVISNDSNGCEVEAVIYDVHIGINEITPFKKILIYPNPVTEKLSISSNPLLGTVPVEISIFNVLGERKKIQSGFLNPSTEIDVSDLLQGLYFLKLSSESKTYGTKFLKQ